MKIYIVEENNNTYWSEPEVFINPDKAVEKVKEEYEQVKSDNNLHEENGYVSLIWEIDENTGVGSAKVENYQDYWQWRITEHEI